MPLGRVKQKEVWLGGRPLRNVTLVTDKAEREERSVERIGLPWNLSDSQVTRSAVTLRALTTDGGTELQYLIRGANPDSRVAGFAVDPSKPYQHLPLWINMPNADASDYLYTTYYGPWCAPPVGDEQGAPNDVSLPEFSGYAGKPEAVAGCNFRGERVALASPSPSTTTVLFGTAAQRANDVSGGGQVWSDINNLLVEDTNAAMIAAAVADQAAVFSNAWSAGSGPAGPTLTAVATVTAWVKRSGSGDNPVVTLYQSATDAIYLMAGKGGFSYDDNATAILRVGGSDVYSPGASVVPNDTWVHVAVRLGAEVGGSGFPVEVFLNGVSDGVAYSASALTTGTYVIQLGCANGNLTGSIDEVKVYDAALSDAAILADYAAGAGVYGAAGGDLVAGYHLDGGATDYSGNGYDLNLGAATYEAGLVENPSADAWSQTVYLSDPDLSAIPSDAIIDTVAISVRRQDSATDVTDRDMLLALSGTAVGNDKSVGNGWADEWETKAFSGAPVAYWGQALTRADLDNLGVTFACNLPAAAAGEVRWVKLAVSWHQPTSYTATLTEGDTPTGRTTWLYDLYVQQVAEDGSFEAFRVARPETLMSGTSLTIGATTIAELTAAGLTAPTHVYAVTVDTGVETPLASGGPTTAIGDMWGVSTGG